MMKTDVCMGARIALWHVLVLAIVLSFMWCGETSVAYAAEQDGERGVLQGVATSQYAVASTNALESAQDELPYDVDWYLVDPDIDSYGISTSRELLGLAQLVNGTALDWEGQPIAAVDFSGRTIELLEDITLIDDGGDTVEFVPIGTPETPFAGTFDGCGHSIRNLSIAHTYTYAGLFGYAGSSSAIKNVNLAGGSNAGIVLSTETDYVANVGALAGKTDGSVSNCSSDVAVSIDSHAAATAEFPYVVQRIGGLVGFARGDMTGCSFSGTLATAVYADAYSADTTSDSLRVADSIGGVVGRFGDPDCHGTLSDSYNIGDITTQTFGAGGADRFGETTFAVTFFVGGVAGYSNGSIYNCHNGSYDVDTQIITGSVFTGVRGADGALLNNRGGDQVGGIVGSLRGESDDPDKYNDGDPDDPMVIADCHNEAQVTGLCATGGIVGQTGVYCTVTRCFNGSITDLADWQRNQQAGKVTSTRWNKPLSGGIVGQTRSGTISYCANYAEVRNIQTGYYMAGIAGCIFTSDDYPNVTGEIYACFNSGGIYTINESTNVEYREAGICGDNEGYVHDCIVMQGSVPYHSDQAIGNMDWGVTSNMYVKSAEELQSPESAALLNAIAAQNQDWTCYWFINREGYPLLNSWAALDESQRIQLTADMIASTEELEPAPYMGPGQDTLPTISVTLTDGTVLIQNTDFYVIPQTGAYEMSADPIYSASIVGIGLYMGTVSDCAHYSIGGGDLSKAAIFIATQKYNFGKVVFPTSVEARIGGAALPADEYEYIIYGSQTSATSVESGSTVFPALDSEGFISYDAAGNVMYPVSDVGIEAINAETRDYWLWDRDGRLISDSKGKTYYVSTGNAYAGTTSCVNLKAGTPAGYVVKVSAKSDSVGLSGYKIGFYVIDPVNLYKDCVFSGALLGDQLWSWDADASHFYIADDQGGVLDDSPAATFTGQTITLDPLVNYGDYQLVVGQDIRVANGDPNPSEVGVSVDEDDAYANRNVTDGTTRAAITVLPVNSSSMSNYLIAYFDIAPADFADCDIQPASSAVAYTGEAVEPEVDVKLNGVTLIAGVDYEISYSDNVEKGTGHFTVTPLANLSGGSIEPYVGSFTIGDGIALGDFTIDAIEDQQFNWGYDVHPQLTFRDANGHAVPLVEGTDYTVTYSGKNVTKWPATDEASESSIDPWTVTVTGRGLYTGELTSTFHIVPYNATANTTNQLRVVTQNLVYGTWGKPAVETNLSDGTKAMRAQFENYGPEWPVVAVAAYPISDWAAYEAGDFESCYADPIAITRQNNNSNGKLVYPYPVRYYDADGNEVAADESLYTNSNREVIARPQAAEPGTITAKVFFTTGTSGAKNGATGSIETTFEYTSPAPLSTVEWTAGSNDARTYDGTAKTPIVATMKGTGAQLVENVDYTIEYTGNVNAGTATYVATAVEGGHFTGAYEGAFSVLPYSLSGDGAATIDDIPDQELADVEVGVEPVPVVRVGDTVLQADVDYEVRYQNNHTIGDNGAVIVVGKGNYTGTATKTFRVVEPGSGLDELSVVVTSEPAAVGSQATFVAAVEGAGDAGLTYAWYYSDNGGAKWYRSSATGQGTAQLTTTFKADKTSRVFRCDVTATDGREASSEPCGFVEAPPAFAVTVTAEPAELGSMATFTAAVTGVQEGEQLTYVWHYSDDGGAKWYRSSATGQGTAQLTTTFKADKTSRVFRCTVTTASGDIAASEPCGFVEAFVARVSTEPVPLGSAATFVANVTGAHEAELSYVWQYSDDGGAKWYRSSASGQGTAQLTTTFKSDKQERVFRCTVTASDGRVAVSEPCGFAEPVGDPISVSVSTQPVAIGEMAVFTASVESAGDAGLTYVWYYSDNGGAKWYKSSATGQGTAQLATTFKADKQTRVFRCDVTASDGRSAVSEPCGFAQATGEPLSVTVSTSSVTVGSTVAFAADVAGADGVALTYTWYYSDNGGAKWYKSSASGQGTSEITVTCKADKQSRVFRCDVTASDGRSATSDPCGFLIA